MKRIIYIIVVLASISSCGIHSKQWETISQVESYIEERPDSALSVLEAINPEDLSGKEEKARYALMLSMALDKNFIDKTDFDVLQPAIGYYGGKGSDTDKLRTLYYQGRIFQNQGNEAAAMTCYLKALDEGEDSDDILTKARLLVAQGNIYNSLMKWDKVCEVNLKAAEYFEQADRINSYINCLLKAVSGYIQKSDNDNVERYLNICSLYSNTMSINLLQSYYSCYITYLISIHSHDLLRDAVQEYESVIPENMIDYISLSSAYLEMNDSEKALEIIASQDNIGNLRQELKYFAVLTKVHQELNQDKKALQYYIEHSTLRDSIVLSIFEQDTQFMEERHKLELNTLKEKESKNIVLLCCILLVVILAVAIFYIITRLKIKTIETERYKLLYQQIETEKDNLSELLVQSDDLNKEARNVVARRLNLLNKFFTAFITNNFEIERKVDKELEDLLYNKEEFMLSTKLAFSGSHPKFIQYLEDKGLTDYEIQYCCLYALGLKGKEVGSYLKMRSHYNISSAVREKLGLIESDTNLGIYIRKKLNSFE